MAEDWSICVEVYGTEPGLAPHRYFNRNILNIILPQISVGIVIPVCQTFLLYMPFCILFCMNDMMEHVSPHSERVFVFPGSTLLTGSSSLQLWSHIDEVNDEAEEGGRQKEMTIGDFLSAWRCIWESK